MDSVRHETLLVTRKFRVERWRDRTHAEHPHDIVVHAGAAVVIPVLPDERLVMILNHRVVAERELLEFPAGTLDSGESPETCARRELKQETGYSAEKFEPLVSFYSTPGICNERMHAFVARELTAGAPALEASERIRTVTMDLEAAMEAAQQGGIEDGKTLVALLFYDRFVRRRGMV